MNDAFWFNAPAANTDRKVRRSWRQALDANTWSDRTVAVVLLALFLIGSIIH